MLARRIIEENRCDAAATARREPSPHDPRPRHPGSAAAPASPSAPDATKRLTYIEGDELVRQSIETILDTEPGERVMLPTFGCGLRRYLMAPNTTATRTAIAADVRQALSLWEPRIRLTNVAVTGGEDPALVWIEIGYVRLVDLRPDNLVYPFYLR